MRLLLLRGMYSAPSWTLLSRLLLFAALFIGVQQVMLWLRRDPGPEQRAARRQGSWLVLALLAAWGLVSGIGYQGAAMRRDHLALAQAAPLRISYGDTAHAPVIQVFTAPGCGPCKSLEGRLQPLIAQGYAVQYIPGSLGGGDEETIEAALCETHPGAAFERVFGMATPAASAQASAPPCGGGVRANEAVLHRIAGMVEFPTVVMPDGFVIVGAVSATRLSTYLSAAAPLPAAPAGGRPL